MLAAALLSLGPGLPIARAQAPAAVDPATLRSRAEAGEPDALNALANAFANGAGVPQNLTEAVRLYELAAAKGHAPALFNLGMMSELGRGLPADLGAAFKRYLRAAELGFAPAQFNVGNMYANGLGVKADFFEAALWFRQAADRAIPEAQYNLALAYELGRGVAKDEAAAQKWYRAAAEQGYARARYNLALMLEQGRGGPADAAEAMNLYRLAAAQNFPPAQNNLGILLAEGRGVPANFVEAFAWLSVAADNGVASDVLALVAQQLSPVGKEEAQAALDLLRIRLGRKSAPTARPPEAAAVVTAEPRTPVPNEAMEREVAGLRDRLRETTAELERVRVENFRLTDSARPAVAAVTTQAAQREVAGLKEQIKLGSHATGADGLPPCAPETAVSRGKLTSPMRRSGSSSRCSMVKQHSVQCAGPGLHRASS
jgi:TPR repeat protein